MSLLKNYTDSSKKNAFALLDGVPTKVSGMETQYKALFSHATLSAASTSFASQDVTAANPEVSKAVTETMDTVASVTQDAQMFQTFLNLHIPKMEDGNNFGVSVQLASLKQLSDLQELTSKQIDDLSAYASSRADCLDKLSLPSASSSVTKSTSVSTTDGKEEKKTSEATEDKSTTTDSSGPAYAARKAALTAVDTLYYSKAQRAYQSTMMVYVSAMDFLDKNKEKLEKPKGSGGSHSGFASMY